MEQFQLNWLGAHVCAAIFQPKGSSVREIHLCVEPAPQGTLEQQLDSIQKVYQVALDELGLRSSSAVFRRLFVSDFANQASALSASELYPTLESGPVAVSVTEQPPFGGRKALLWAYHVQSSEPLEKKAEPNGVILRRNEFEHIWTAGLNCPSASGAFNQTKKIFDRYQAQLSPHSANLRDHVVRTWLYVQNIDVNYGAMVDARKRVFCEQGLTDQTHFIASTGIEGRHQSPLSTIIMDAYALAGSGRRAVRYLHAPEMLGPTHLYGVTFERGTQVSYADRSHTFISGTASIDPEGKTLHVGNVQGQCDRALANIEALLHDAGASFSDMAQLTVYLRDPGDQLVIRKVLGESFPTVPQVLVRAPVCRPNWLIELECIALTQNQDQNLDAF